MAKDEAKLRSKFPYIYQRVCPVCGKSFIPAYMHAYHDGESVVCSWNCQIEAEKRREEARANKRHYRGKAIEPGRDDNILKLAKEGVDTQEIADKYGLTVDRIRQIIRSGLHEK